MQIEIPRAPFSWILKINAYWFGLSFLWNGLHQLILPAVLLNYINYQEKNTTLGLLTFAGLCIAVVIQPISGAVSDRWNTIWGRRRPLILLGTLGDFIFLAILAWSRGLLWITVGYIGLQFTSNIAHGPAQGLVPDTVPPIQRGMASGIKNLMDMGGLVVGMLILGNVFDPQANHLVIAIILIAAFLAVGAIITLVGRKENPAEKFYNSGASSNIIQPMLLSRERLKSYSWLIASRFVFLLGVYGVQGFIQYYIRDEMNVNNPVKLTADLLSIIILALMAFAMTGGWLGDRFGHKRMLYIASIIGAVGSLLLIGAHNSKTLLMYGSVFGAAIGLFLTANWALANLLVPSEQAGKYLGLSNLATAGAGAVARLTGPLIDLLNNARKGVFMGYTFLFILGAITTLGSALLLRKVIEIEYRSNKA